MHLFLGDETNRTQSGRSKFFIYGGLIVDVEAVPSLDVRIAEIRQEVPLRDTDSLKFETRARPEDVSIDDHTRAKSAAIDACVDHGVQFISYLVLHVIARDRLDRTMGFALNTLLWIFNGKFLAEHDDNGMCIVDRFDGDHDHLREKHQRGVYMEDDDTWVSLDRVKLYASTCDGASHLSSPVDIVLGALRYCVNEEERLAVPRELLPRVAGMMYHRKEGDNLYLRDYELTLRPQRVRVAQYQQEYDALVEKLGRLVAEDANEVEGQN